MVCCPVQSLEASHDDAVGDDQADKYRKLLAHIVDEGLEKLIHQDHQRGHDNELNDDPDPEGIRLRINEMTTCPAQNKEHG